MSKKSLIRNFALTAAVLATSVSVGFAQKDKEQPSQDPTTKDRKVGKEVKKVYTDWVNKDVAYVITGDEKKRLRL